MSDTKTRAEKKLSVIPKGSWRNVYRFPRTYRFDGGVLLGPGDLPGTKGWPSREIAEEKAAWFFRVSPVAHEITYLGAKFFPDP